MGVPAGAMANTALTGGVLKEAHLRTAIGAVHDLIVTLAERAKVRARGAGNYKKKPSVVGGLLN